MNCLSDYYFDVFEYEVIDGPDIECVILCLTPKDYSIKENAYIDRSPEDPKIYKAFERMSIEYYDDENGSYEIIGITKKDLINKLLAQGAVRWIFNPELPNNGRPE